MYSFSNRENTLPTNLFHKFGAEQINGKPKRKIKLLQIIGLSDLFLKEKFPKLKEVYEHKKNKCYKYNFCIYIFYEYTYNICNNTNI